MTLNPNQFDGFEYKGVNIKNVRSGKKTKNPTMRSVQMKVDDTESDYHHLSKAEAEKWVDTGLEMGAKVGEGRLSMEKPVFDALEGRFYEGLPKNKPMYQQMGRHNLVVKQQKIEKERRDVTEYYRNMK